MPTYEAWGLIATLSFAILRVLQSFFLGGEYNGGAIYCLEHEKDRAKHGIVSGLYCAFTVSGIILASFVATVCTMLGSQYFRVAYALSFVFALCTYAIRRKIRETPEFVAHNVDLDASRQIYFSPRNLIIAIAIASLFFGIIYGLPTRIFNAILPLYTKISVGQIMIINTIFLIIYMVLLIIFGAAANNFGAARIMRSAVVLTTVMAYPVMRLVDMKTFSGIIIAKAIFAMLAAASIGPFLGWAQQLFPPHRRYAGISLSYCVGKCVSTVGNDYLDHVLNAVQGGVTMVQVREKGDDMQAIESQARALQRVL